MRTDAVAPKDRLSVPRLEALSGHIGRHSAALSRQRPLERERAFITVASRTSREPGAQDFRYGSVLIVQGRHVTGIVALQTIGAF
jgi:hypothetical protein